MRPLRSTLSLVLTGVLLMMAAGVARAEEPAAPDTSISGTVTGTPGQPLPSVDVVPYLWDEATRTYDTVGGDAMTNSEGVFTISGIPEGWYTLHFNPEDPDYPERWWNGRTSLEGADRFQVVAGSPNVGMDAQLLAGEVAEGSLAGTVTDRDGQPLGGATVTAYEYLEYEDEDGGYSTVEERGSATVAADGTYTIGSLPEGQYYLKAALSGHVSRWWPDARDQWQADLIDLRVDRTATGIDLRLEAGGTISGQLTGSDGPLAGAEVYAYLWDDEDEYFAEAGSATTDGDGRYIIGELPSGDYTLRFEAPSGSGYVSQWWSDRRDEESADTFPLTSGAVLTGKDARLALGATVTGTVTDAAGFPLPGVEVIPYLWDEGSQTYDTVGGDAMTNADGIFTITGIPEGHYTLRFDSEDDAYAGQWWRGRSHQSLADRFEALVGQPSEGMDVRLAPGSSISGTVTGSKAQPLSGVEVGAYLILPSGRSEEAVATAETDENGRYSIRGLPAGTYTLHFRPSDGVHASKWWHSGDAVLQKGTILSGKVTDKAGNPVGQALICLHWRPTGDGGCGAESDQNGNYTWPGALEPDTYDLAVWVGGFDTGTRYEVGAVTIEAGVEAKTRDIVVDLGSQRRMGAQRSMAVQAAVDSVPTGEGFAVAAGASIRGKDVQLALEGAEAELTGPVPTISGQVLVGAVLTASAGDWQPAPVSLAYQWKRNGTPIAGATASTYRVQVADVNSTLSVTVTASRSGFAPLAKTSTATSKVPKAAKLTKTPTPTVSGKVRVGGTLTANAGSWKPSPVSLSYQWYRSGSKIDGATKRTYTLVAADKSRRITVRVTGSRIGYAPVVRTSKETKKVAAGVLATAKPKISGTARVGKTLTVKTGAWKPAATTFTYRWYRGGKRIQAAKGASYTLVAADKGKKITVTVTGSSPGYTSASRKSAKTKAVVAGALTPATPTITGTAVVGHVLSANPGAWRPAGVTFSYQWYRSGRAIKSATRSTYALTSADVGKIVTVRVTGSLRGYRSSIGTSAGMPVTFE